MKAVMTFGNGDPSIDAECTRRHEEAVSRGDRFYLDPKTGYYVHTAPSLLSNGRCCGAGCRHCPYPSDVQRLAGRRTVREG